MSLFVLASQEHLESRLSIVLLQLTVIILIARVFAILFRKLGQPSVVGEIAAGLVLGPSVLGKLEQIPWLHIQGLSHRVFDPSVGPVMEILSQLGLIFLLFLIGLEFDFKHLKSHSRSAMSISVVGVLLPFTLGWALAHFLHPRLAEHVELRGFALFMGTAMSITAIPILGRMMMELNISRTRLGAITITAAAVDDATGWILLAAVSAMVRANFNPMQSVKMISLTLTFALGVIVIARPILQRWIAFALRKGGGELGINSLAILLAIMFLCAIATAKIGIFAIFGAFILGASLSDQHEFREAVVRQLRNFITVFFLPIFFTYTGLRTDIGSLNTPTLWIFAALVSAAAIIGKFGGCAIAARLSGFSGRESACIGVMMNTRALMELIVVNVGYELGVIPRSVFCMLVMMALLTTVMTTPILLRLSARTELEEHVASSGFSLRLKPA